MFKKIFYAAGVALLGLALASTPSLAQKTKAAMQSEINTNFADNSTGLITPSLARAAYIDMINSWQQFAFVNTQSGSTYTVATTDYGQLVAFTNSGAVAVTLPQATGSFAVFSVYLKNYGTGTVTVTPTTSTIDGGATLVLPAGSAAFVVSDGANYEVVYVAGSGIATNAQVWQGVAGKLIDAAVAQTAIVPQVLTIATSTFTPAFGAGINFEVTLVHASCPCTIANGTGVYAGLSGMLTIKQSSTGNDTVSWGTNWKFSGGTAPTLSTAANAVDILPFYCRTTTFCVVTFIANAT